MHGYLESWSVESAGMTEQVLALWKFVRSTPARIVDKAQPRLSCPDSEPQAATHNVDKVATPVEQQMSSFEAEEAIECH